MVPDEEAFKWAMSGCAKVPPVATADDSIESPLWNLGLSGSSLEIFGRRLAGDAQ